MSLPKVKIKDDSFIKHLKIYKPNYKEDKKILLDYRKFGKYVSWKGKKPIFKGGFGNDKIKIKSKEALNTILKLERAIRLKNIFTLFKNHLKEVKGTLNNDITIPKPVHFSNTVLCKKYKQRNKSLIKSQSMQSLEKFSNPRTIKSTSYSSFCCKKENCSNVSCFPCSDREIFEKDLFIPDYELKKYDKNFVFKNLGEKFEFFTQKKLKNKDDQIKYNTFYYEKNKYSMYESKEVKFHKNNLLEGFVKIIKRKTKR